MLAQNNLFTITFYPIKALSKLIALIILSQVIIGCNSILHPPKKTFNKNIVLQPFDAIIVPGVPYNGTEWDNIMKIRVQWAKMLYDSGYAKNIIFSGGAVYTKYVESKVMAKHAQAMNIPSEHIFVETQAEHSTENVYYSYLIAKEKGFTNIALATDPYQLKRMRRFIRKDQLPVALLPIVFSQLTQTERLDPKVNCEDTAVEKFVSIKERESLFKRLQGTFGKQIIWYEEDVKRPSKKKKLIKQGRLIERTD